MTDPNNDEVANFSIDDITLVFLGHNVTKIKIASKIREKNFLA